MLKQCIIFIFMFSILFTTEAFTQNTNPQKSIQETIKSLLNSVDVKRGCAMGSCSISSKNSKRVLLKFKPQLQDYSNEEVINGLLVFLDDEDSTTRWKAMHYLIYFNYSDSKRVRQYWMDENDWLVRGTVLNAVKNFPRKNAFDLVYDILKYDDNGRNRRSALDMLERFSNEDEHQKIIDIYLESLSDDNRWVRNAAFKWLRERRITEAVEKAKQLILRDEENYVRVGASYLLADLGDIESLRYVLSAGSRKLINDHVLKKSLQSYIERFGKDALLTEVAKIKSQQDKDKAERIILEEKLPK